MVRRHPPSGSIRGNDALTQIPAHHFVPDSFATAGRSERAGSGVALHVNHLDLLCVASKVERSARFDAPDYRACIRQRATCKPSKANAHPQNNCLHCVSRGRFIHTSHEFSARLRRVLVAGIVQVVNESLLGMHSHPTIGSRVPTTKLAMSFHH